LGGRFVQKLVAEVMAAWRSAERLAGEMPATDPLRRVAVEAAEQLQVVFGTLTMVIEGDDEPDGSQSELEERVVQTSDEIAADLRRLHAIERLKVSRRADGERLLELSREARGLSVEIATKAEDQLNLAEEAAELEKDGQLPRE
jgi:hypothetical protein